MACKAANVWLSASIPPKNTNIFLTTSVAERSLATTCENSSDLNFKDKHLTIGEMISKK